VRFELATAGRIVFGRGCFDELPDHVAALGRRVLLVTGASAERTGAQQRLRERGLPLLGLRFGTEPTTAAVCEGVALARDHGAEVVVGIGGGSVLDGAKAIAALLQNPGDPLDYLEVVGRGRALENPSLPCVAVPTTAGTGSEVTRNAVLSAPEHAVKVSLRSASMLPRLALVDPLLTVGLPPALTGSTGLDALTQLVEPLVSRRSNPVTSALCRDGIARAARSLRRACQDGSDLDAREDMSLASLLGGIALANAGLGAVHGFAGPLGGRLGAPHGALCACLLPHVIRTNADALRRRAPESPALDRLAEAARLLTGRPGATPEEGADWLEELGAWLEIPGLARHGLTAADIPAVLPQARAASSMKANPIDLTDDELTTILTQALGT
jgi:alcohol dehydrogenase class IV